MIIIAIEGIKIQANHGVYEAERKRGTLFVVDVNVHAEIELAGIVDDLSHTIDYQSIYELTLNIMSNPVNLLETLVQKLGNEILEHHRQAAQVTVRVSKVTPLEMDRCDRTFVEATFTRGDH